MYPSQKLSARNRAAEKAEPPDMIDDELNGQTVNQILPSALHHPVWTQNWFSDDAIRLYQKS